jgi:hypothetical protein
LWAMVLLDVPADSAVVRRKDHSPRSRLPLPGRALAAVRRGDQPIQP